MSSGAADRSVTMDRQAQRGLELFLNCVREGFTGNLEFHFLKGVPRSAKKTEPLELGDRKRDLMPRG